MAKKKLTKHELFIRLQCAITHNIIVCETCKKCAHSPDSTVPYQTRLDLLKDLTDFFTNNGKEDL